MSRTRMANQVLQELGVTLRDNKTPLMLLVEARFHHPIEELLTEGLLNDRALAKQLGINFTTLSKWRKKLGLHG